MKKVFKFIISCLAVSVFLCGCKSAEKTESSPESDSKAVEDIPVTETSAVHTEKETVTENKTEVFSGFEITEISLSVGNTPSSLNQNGLLYCDDEKMLFNDINSNLILQRGEQRKTIADSVSAKCINVINDNIYFINSADKNQAYLYNISNDKCEVYIDDYVSFLMIVDDTAVYEDENHQLISFRNGITEIISSQQVLWVDIFADNIIYTELNGNNSTVKAFNINTNENITLLDYGFSPSVYNEYLYYQAKSGEILRLNLLDGKSEEFCSEWGQQFCFTQDEFYFLNSKGINGKNGIVYQPENDEFSVMSIFSCNNELYFTEGNDSETYLYQLNVETNEKDLIE